MTPDTEGLHPIANTDQSDRVADIVFVHGPECKLLANSVLVELNKLCAVMLSLVCADGEPSVWNRDDGLSFRDTLRHSHPE